MLKKCIVYNLPSILRMDVRIGLNLKHSDVKIKTEYVFSVFKNSRKSTLLPFCAAFMKVAPDVTAMGNSSLYI